MKDVTRIIVGGFGAVFGFVSSYLLWLGISEQPNRRSQDEIMALLLMGSYFLVLAVAMLTSAAFGGSTHDARELKRTQRLKSQTMRTFGQLNYDLGRIRDLAPKLASRELRDRLRGLRPPTGINPTFRPLSTEEMKRFQDLSRHLGGIFVGGSSLSLLPTDHPSYVTHLQELHHDLDEYEQLLEQFQDMVA